MRLFFALWPSASERQALLQAVQAPLQAVRGRAVPHEKLHVTLAFLGEVPPARLPSLLELAAGLASPAFELVFDRLEHWRRARVLAAVASALPPAASQLADALRERLVAAGFRPDLKPFRAHVTLAREVEASAATAMPAVALGCHEFMLVESRTERSGALYSVLGRWRLYDAENT